MADRQFRLREAADLLRGGRFADALRIAAPLLAANPDNADAELAAGLALGGLGHVDQAAALLIRVARARPGFGHPCADLANLLRTAGRPADAEAHFRAALALTPDDAALCLAYAGWLKEAGRAPEAIAHLEHAVATHPDHAPMLSALAVTCAETGQMDRAILLFRRAAEANPHDATGFANLCEACATEARFEEAFAASDKAVALAPQDARIHVNRAVALLKSGRLPEGFAEFVWRHRLQGRRTRLHGGAALQPDAPLSGRTVMLTHEEGFGDTLQFLRFAAPLAASGARVIAQVPKELARLVRRAPGVAALAEGPILPPFDAHCPFLDAPCILGTTVETVPAEIPYLSVDPAEVASWATRLPDWPGFRVGLVWAGAARRHDAALVAVDRRRSLALDALAPLGSVPGMRFIGLQKGPAAVQAKTSPFALHDPMDAVTDFADTAAIIANLDVVVSVDTSVAHLAGAMGKPVFLLDRYDNCWRWLTGREDSPWYPTLRIFRQRSVGDWSDPVSRVAAALAAFRH